jgi:hypothetical protein
LGWRAAQAFLELPAAAELIMAPATPKKWRLLMFILNPSAPWFSQEGGCIYIGMAFVC